MIHANQAPVAGRQVVQRRAVGDGSPVPVRHADCPDEGPGVRGRGERILRCPFDFAQGKA